MAGGRIVRKSRGRRFALASVVAVVPLLSLGAPAAHAVHLFPATPVFDPIGHDCAKNLDPPPEPQGATALVVGFSFIDASSRSSTTTIAAGQSVTWEWLADHCHSVTFSPTVGTVGAPGFTPAQPQLVRKDGDGDTFTLSFPLAGSYDYLCVHHADVGMRGKVVVTPG